VSSHLMSEMALTADHLIVIGRGRLIADASVDEVVRRASGGAVRVRTPDAGRLRDVLVAEQAAVDGGGDGLLEVRGLSAEQVGKAAFEHGIALYELTPQQASLEEAFMELTQEDVEYRAPSEASAEGAAAR
jgi:ABC-2 type transport system ATP-binding protein